jgi:hypothetical protein
MRRLWRPRGRRVAGNDINVMVDVDSDEAQTLIELTALLFDERHIVRKQHADRLKRLGVRLFSC